MEEVLNEALRKLPGLDVEPLLVRDLQARFDVLPRPLNLVRAHAVGGHAQHFDEPSFQGRGLRCV